MRAHTWPAAFSALKVSSTYSRVSTALSPATTWKQSWSNATPWYSKRIDSSLPLWRPRILNSSALLIGSYSVKGLSFAVGKASLPHSVGEGFEERGGVVPAQARVGDGHAVRERLAGHEVLASGIEMAFHHHADDALLAGGKLRGDVGRDFHLLAVVL